MTNVRELLLELQCRVQPAEILQKALWQAAPDHGVVAAMAGGTAQ